MYDSQYPLSLSHTSHTCVPPSISRTGCKPFVEIFQNGERVFTSASQESMERIRSFTSEDRAVEVPLGVTVKGNLLVVVHHIRTIPITKKAGLVSVEREGGRGGRSAPCNGEGWK